MFLDVIFFEGVEIRRNVICADVVLLEDIFESTISSTLDGITMDQDALEKVFSKVIVFKLIRLSLVGDDDFEFVVALMKLDGLFLGEILQVEVERFAVEKVEQIFAREILDRLTFCIEKDKGFVLIVAVEINQFVGILFIKLFELINGRTFIDIVLKIDFLEEIPDLGGYHAEDGNSFKSLASFCGVAIDEEKSVGRIRFLGDKRRSCLRDIDVFKFILEDWHVLEEFFVSKLTENARIVVLVVDNSLVPVDEERLLLLPDTSIEKLGDLSKVILLGICTFLDEVGTDLLSPDLFLNLCCDSTVLEGKMQRRTETIVENVQVGLFVEQDVHESVLILCATNVQGSVSTHGIDGIDVDFFGSQQEDSNLKTVFENRDDQGSPSTVVISVDSLALTLQQQFDGSDISIDDSSNVRIVVGQPEFLVETFETQVVNALKILNRLLHVSVFEKRSHRFVGLVSEDVLHVSSLKRHVVVLDFAENVTDETEVLVDLFVHVVVEKDICKVQQPLLPKDLCVIRNLFEVNSKSKHSSRIERFDVFLDKVKSDSLVLNF